MTLVYNPGGNGYIFKSLDVIDLDFGLDYFFGGISFFVLIIVGHISILVTYIYVVVLLYFLYNM